MLEAERRLTATADFNAVYKKGKQQSSPNLRLSYRSTNQNTLRFGFVVSKKHALKIADRNRIKRVMRSTIREILPLLGNLRGYDIVLQARPGIAKVLTKDLRQEISFLLNKAKILPKWPL